MFVHGSKHTVPVRYTYYYLRRMKTEPYRLVFKKGYERIRTHTDEDPKDL